MTRKVKNYYGCPADDSIGCLLEYERNKKYVKQFSKRFTNDLG